MTTVPDFRSLTVEALAEQIRTGPLTAEAVTEAALDRIARLNPAVNAFVAVDEASARGQAVEIDRRLGAGEPVGPLAGVPLGVKDLADAAGFASIKGAAHRRNIEAATTDSTEVARLRAAGCVVIGKTNTPEFGWVGDTYNPVFGITSNPWDLQRSPGGSSGGSAAAIAAGMVPLATGSDGGGSLRIPSALTALSGYKPTQGVVPSGPAPMGASDLSTVGPMARRIRDVALGLDIVAGPSAGDLRSMPSLVGSFRAACNEPRAPKRVLWCASVDGSDVDEEVLAITSAAVDQIRAAGVEVVGCAPLLADTLSPFLMLFYGGIAGVYTDMVATPAYEDVTEGLRLMMDGVRPRLSIASLEEARMAAQAASLRLADTMAGFDALLSPVAVGQTPRSRRGGTVNGVETPAWVGNTFPFNVTRRPAGCTHAGLTADGLPVGLQIVGGQLEDLRTVELTAWVEDLLGFDPVAPFPET